MTASQVRRAHSTPVVSGAWGVAGKPQPWAADGASRMARTRVMAALNAPCRYQVGVQTAREIGVLPPDRARGPFFAQIGVRHEPSVSRTDTHGSEGRPFGLDLARRAANTKRGFK